MKKKCFSTSWGKWANLGQKKKFKKLSLLGVVGKNKLFLQYPIRKFDIFSSIVLKLFQKLKSY